MAGFHGVNFDNLTLELPVPFTPLNAGQIQPGQGREFINIPRSGIDFLLSWFLWYSLQTNGFMKIFAILNIAAFLLSTAGYSQSTITGTFPALSNQQVKLVGFEGFNTYTIDSVSVSEKGAF